LGEKGENQWKGDSVELNPTVQRWRYGNQMPETVSHASNYYKSQEIRDIKEIYKYTGRDIQIYRALLKSWRCANIAQSLHKRWKKYGSYVTIMSGLMRSFNNK
jgi:hypothetical protein